MTHDNSSTAGLSTHKHSLHSGESPEKATLFPKAKRRIQLHTLPSSNAAFPLQLGGFPELKADLSEG